MDAPIGFVGLGVMGRPMAANLVRGGVPLVVWSRRPESCAEAERAGAAVAGSVAEVFARCRIVLTMLATEEATDAVLHRGRPAFAELVADHVLVQMGTTSPEYSARLAADVEAAGGTYVEAPVSGSRVPAERGELVALVAGPAGAKEELRPVLTPMCQAVFDCGAVPSGLTTKLAVNLYLVTTVAALAEAAHFAERQGLDLGTFAEILAAGQTASPISRIKAAKLRDRDFAVQAAIADVRKNSRLVAEAARAAGIAAPLTDLADRLYAETVELGYGGEDMAAVVRALEARTAAQAPAGNTAVAR
jgi:3-hydroxyisobutyrate dehydrogenase